MAVDWDKFYYDEANESVLTVVGFELNKIRFNEQWRRYFFLNRPKAVFTPPGLNVFYVTNLRWELVPGSTKAGITLMHRRFTWDIVEERGPTTTCNGLVYRDQNLNQHVGTYCYLGYGSSSGFPPGQPIGPLYYLDGDEPEERINYNVCTGKIPG